MSFKQMNDLAVILGGESLTYRLADFKWNAEFPVVQGEQIDVQVSVDVVNA